MPMYAPLQFKPSHKVAAPQASVETPFRTAARKCAPAKLLIGNAFSPSEREAHQTAEHVFLKPEAKQNISTSSEGNIQGSTEGGSSDLWTLHRTVGSPLPHHLRRDFEQRFGRDFSQVRVHTGDESASIAHQLGAKAFTLGNDVGFARGRYQPDSAEGRHLLAHELTHVVQRSPTIQLEPNDANPSTTSASPQPASLRSMVGNINYYRARNNDYLRRHTTPSPPDYYLNYGDKYAHRFTEVLRPKLSPTGQYWLDRTFVLLQEAIENRRDRDPLAFDRLEQNNDAFRSFAYQTHKDAYLNAGLRFLPITDLARIAATPYLDDLLTVDGIRQILGTGMALIPQWGENVVESAERAVGNMEREIYHLYGAPLP